MFLGSYKPSFDLISRRIALPKKIRESLATGELVLSYGFEKCIFGFDTKVWEKQSTDQLSAPLSERSARFNRRLFFSTAAIVKFDDQGRIVIPYELLQYAKIRKPIVAGAGDHFEIWDESLWKKELEGSIRRDG